MQLTADPPNDILNWIGYYQVIDIEEENYLFVVVYEKAVVVVTLGKVVCLEKTVNSAVPSPWRLLYTIYGLN